MELLVADRSDRGKLRITGEQDAWFLHQILTQDFENMPVGEARDAAQLTAHGRMVGYLEFVRTSDAFLAHYESSLAGTYPEELQRYVFATRVELEDVTDEMGLVLVAGEGWAEFTGSLADVVPHPTRCLGTDAGYLWVPAGAARSVLDAAEKAGARPVDENELERIRVTNGAPRWGAEMDNKTIPQEAGIDRWAVHFEKGCYVGQEAMAKIHFRGKVNRRLARLRGPSVAVGAEVNNEGRKVGRVTSAVDGDALAILSHTIEPGATVEIGGEEAEVVA